VVTACSTNGGDDEYIYAYWWESQKERDLWEEQGVCGLAVLKWILER
jgi:hypothetical protein